MTERHGDYDSWAWLYNRTLGPEYCREKLAFLERTLLARTPAGGRILDLCCGTGQMISPIVERGFAVTGLDGSADMLRFARQNAAGTEFVQGDARAFRFDDAFDGVLCTSASLNHMSGLGDLRQVFDCVHRALRDGGVFVFDVNHPAQLIRYWRGQPAEGEIRPDYAWLITPRYDAAKAEGSFTVDIYRRPPGDTAAAPFPRLLSALLGHRLLRRRRLQLLARFARLRPQWERRSTDYPIHGHDLEALQALLRDAGFDASLQTISGDSDVTEQSAAHFVCTKTRHVARAAEARSKAQAGSAL